MFMLFPVYTLLFLSEIISFLHYSTMRKDLFHVQHNTKQTCMFPFSKHQTTLPPQTTIKQARFYKPCIYDKQLGFNKPAVVIAYSLFVESGICVLTVVCAICSTSVQSRVSEQTHRKSPALAHKQTLIKNYCFYDQTTQNYSTVNNRNKHCLHFTPFSRPKS